jgi:NAD-dependent SIR2 family protein deacetylase
MFSRVKYDVSDGLPGTFEEKVALLKKQINEADAILVGAGAGLSTSAGFIYNGERFHEYFDDFIKAYNISDIYSGGFYPFPDEETFWAWWSRAIYINRYLDAPKPVYQELLAQIKDKDYFVLTTNVDHMFQKAGFDKTRLFYTQGDYGLFQSVEPEINKTYDNEEIIYQMLESQGFTKNSEGIYGPDGKISMRIDSDLIPYCPDDGKKMTTNLRVDDAFVQDEGWYAAQNRYVSFIKKHERDHLLYLECGVGMNTPVIIKYPFIKAVMKNKQAFYANLNFNEAFSIEAIKNRSLCINNDIGETLKALEVQ